MLSKYTAGLMRFDPDLKNWKRKGFAKHSSGCFAAWLLRPPDGPQDWSKLLFADYAISSPAKNGASSQRATAFIPVGRRAQRQKSSPLAEGSMTRRKAASLWLRACVTQNCE